jgi:UDP-N-acetylglucosamine acyltransferase
MRPRIHPSAVVEMGAVLADGVEVGPFCWVGPDVELGEGTQLLAHATLFGPTRIGRRCRIYPGATLGAPPQDRSFAGEPTALVIGDDNTFREQVTVHRGTSRGGGLTKIGSRCLLMVGAHVAHDCRLDDDVVLTNLTTLGGHVCVQRHVVCGGHVAVAPFVSLGQGSFVAGGARVERNVPPFVIAAGDRARVRALNRVGVERMGIPESSRSALKGAYRAIWASGSPLQRGIAVARAQFGHDPYVAQLVEFLTTRSD